MTDLSNPYLCTNSSLATMNHTGPHCRDDWYDFNGTETGGNVTAPPTDVTSSTFYPNDTSPNLGPDPPWLLPIEACIFLITDQVFFSTWIITATLIVVVAFARDPKLRTIQNYYIVSLACGDFFIGSTVMPLSLYSYLYAEGWPIRSRPLCKFWSTIDYWLTLQGALSICLISYDRYKMVLHPIAYRNEETPRRALSRIAGTWVFSFLFYGPVRRLLLLGRKDACCFEEG